MAQDCSNHKKEVAGISDMKVLAEMIGDLHYETLKDFLYRLSEKIYEDGEKDFIAGRIKLGHELFMASEKIDSAFRDIRKAWQISKPFMEDKTTLK